MFGQKTPDIPDRSNYKFRISNGDRGFFLNGSPKGLIIGPLSDEMKSGLDDHLTVGIDEREEFDQIHRKIDGKEIWRLTPESLGAEFHRFWASNSESLNPTHLDQPNSYIISWNRAAVILALMTTLFTFFSRLFRFLFVKTEMVRKKDNAYEIAPKVNKRRVERVLLALVLPLGGLFRLLGMIPETKKQRILKGLLKRFLINPTDYRRLENDWGFWISPKKMGLLRLGEKKGLKFIPVSAFAELYQKIEKSVPFGKLSEVGSFEEGTVIGLEVKGSKAPKQ